MAENKAETVIKTGDLQAYGIAFTFNWNDEFGGLLIGSLANNQIVSMRLRTAKFKITIEEIELDED